MLRRNFDFIAIGFVLCGMAAIQHGPCASGRLAADVMRYEIQQKYRNVALPPIVDCLGRRLMMPRIPETPFEFGRGAPTSPHRD